MTQLNDFERFQTPALEEFETILNVENIPARIDYNGQKLSFAIRFSSDSERYALVAEPNEGNDGFLLSCFPQRCFADPDEDPNFDLVEFVGRLNALGAYGCDMGKFTTDPRHGWRYSLEARLDEFPDPSVFQRAVYETLYQAIIALVCYRDYLDAVAIKIASAEEFDLTDEERPAEIKLMYLDCVANRLGLPSLFADFLKRESWESSSELPLSDILDCPKIDDGDSETFETNDVCDDFTSPDATDGYSGYLFKGDGDASGYDGWLDKNNRDEDEDEDEDEDGDENEDDDPLRRACKDMIEGCRRLCNWLRDRHRELSWLKARKEILESIRVEFSSCGPDGERDEEEDKENDNDDYDEFNFDSDDYDVDSSEDEAPKPIKSYALCRLVLLVAQIDRFFRRNVFGGEKGVEDAVEEGDDVFDVYESGMFDEAFWRELDRVVRDNGDIFRDLACEYRDDEEDEEEPELKEFEEFSGEPTSSSSDTFEMDCRFLESVVLESSNKESSEEKPSDEDEIDPLVARYLLLGDYERLEKLFLRYPKMREDYKRYLERRSAALRSDDEEDNDEEDEDELDIEGDDYDEEDCEENGDDEGGAV